MSSDLERLAKSLHMQDVHDYLNVLRADCGSAPPPRFSSDVMLPILDHIEALEAEVASVRTQYAAYRETTHEALQAANARAERLRVALETIAEEHDAGRHDGIYEACPAHEADVMFAIARKALEDKQ